MDLTVQAEVHSWRFFRAGGFDQVLLESGADLAALRHLDQKLWVALSCPVQGVEFDPRTLELLDSDQDGHLRAPEILAAIAWATPRLTSLDLLVSPRDSLPLAAISRTSAEGERLFASARSILSHLGKEDAAEISVAEATDQAAIFAESRCNGDGVITARTAVDPDLAAWIGTIIERQGAIADRSGEDGINAATLEAFAAEIEGWLTWRDAAPNLLAEAPASELDSLSTLWLEVRDKVEDFFVRCRLAAFDPRAAIALNSSDEGLLALAPQALSTSSSELLALPLALIDAAALLPLGQGLNPAWSARIERFNRELLFPLLGPREFLSAREWERIKEELSLLADWWQARVDTPLIVLGEGRLRQWREEGVATKLQALIEEDLLVQAEAEGVIEVETMTRLCRDFFPLLNNFVSFRDFYTRREKAIFQAGRLYLDGRSCDLCVPVIDPAKHAALASLSRLFLVYCDCTRSGGSEKMTIAAAVTSGETDQIRLGRNGIFYDRQGRDWDATVVRLIEHPIDLRQSFWSPYRRVGRMIGDQMQKLAAARSKATEEKAAGSILQSGQSATEGKVPPQPFDVAKFAGIFAALGLAVGAIGTALASVVTGLFRLAWWQIPLVFIVVMLLISGPAMFLDWLKLRQRNLGPLLDANGWAVNARARINLPFGATLTQIARLPAGSRQLLADPFAEKKQGWKIWLLLLLVVAALVFAWQNGWIFTPHKS